MISGERNENNSQWTRIVKYVSEQLWNLLNEEKKLPDTITLIMVMVWDILGIVIKCYIMQTDFG